MHSEVSTLNPSVTEQSYRGYSDWIKKQEVEGAVLSQQEYASVASMILNKSLQDLFDSFHRAVQNSGYSPCEADVFYTATASRTDVLAAVKGNNEQGDGGKPTVPSKDYVPVILDDFDALDLTAASKVSETVTNAMMKYRERILPRREGGEEVNLHPLKAWRWNKRAKNPGPGFSTRIVVLNDFSSTGDQVESFLESIFENNSIVRSVKNGQAIIVVYCFCISRIAFRRLMDFKASKDMEIGANSFNIDYEYVCISLKNTTVPIDEHDRIHLGVKYGITEEDSHKSPLSLFAGDWTVPNNLPHIFTGFKRKEGHTKTTEGGLLYGYRINKLIGADAFDIYDSRLEDPRFRRLFSRRVESSDSNIASWFSAPRGDVHGDLLALFSKVRSSFDIMECTGLRQSEVRQIMTRLTYQRYIEQVKSHKYQYSSGWKMTKLGYSALCRKLSVCSEQDGYQGVIDSPNLTGSRDRDIVDKLLKGRRPR